MPDQLRFRNEDLLLKVSANISPEVWDDTPYLPFLNRLCGPRTYQVEAVRTVLRYWLGGRYANQRELARESWDGSVPLRQRYPAWEQLERALQLPDQLACTVDLATGTGKSYVLYGLARIMLAHGAVDRVLVLVPSRTIETQLSSKFTDLGADADLRDLLPENNSGVLNPRVIHGDRTLAEGTICVENFHQALESAGSSLRSSLSEGRGSRTLVLNDEVHHLYSPSTELRKWKEFLQDEEFAFHMTAGVSGTCYVGSEYFTDVVSAFNLRKAIEQGFVKLVDYVAEDSGSVAERMQKIYANHEMNKQTYSRVRPLTILVTRDIAACKRLTEDLRRFLSEHAGLTEKEATERVLIVTSHREHAANLARLATVDSPSSQVEWITSVSMLTEGWDVQNVFQIVPSEERAFNSKLLIAQVLGRGLRVPPEYAGQRPVVTVFNHDSWSGRIKHLVDEVLMIEKRVGSYPVDQRDRYNFTVHNLDYSRHVVQGEDVKAGPPDFSSGRVSLVSQVAESDQETVYARAGSSQQQTRRTRVRYKMYSIEEVVEHIGAKLAAVDSEAGTNFAEQYNAAFVTRLIEDSLSGVGETGRVISEANRQRLQRAFGALLARDSRAARYERTSSSLVEVGTATRKRVSIGVGSLRTAEAAIHYADDAIEVSDPETASVLAEVIEDDTLPALAVRHVPNLHYLKSPTNVVLTNRKPERQFVDQLVKHENATLLQGWLKSSDTDFYSIEYSYAVGPATLRGHFNPDFFVQRDDNTVYVVEIKDDAQVSEPSPENRAKFRAASDHFDRVNAHPDNPITYCFHFLAPQDYDGFFNFLRDRNLSYVSALDAALT